MTALSLDDKLAAIFMATAVSCDGEVLRPNRRYCAKAMLGVSRGWMVYDRFFNGFLPDAEVGKLDFDILLQEFGSA